MKNDIIIAAKCAPQEKLLKSIEEAGLKAVELYLSSAILNNEEMVRAAK